MYLYVCMYVDRYIQIYIYTCKSYSFLSSSRTIFGSIYRNAFICVTALPHEVQPVGAAGGPSPWWGGSAGRSLWCFEPSASSTAGASCRAGTVEH